MIETIPAPIVIASAREESLDKKVKWMFVIKNPIPIIAIEVLIHAR
jgi:hypothetical protein